MMRALLFLLAVLTGVFLLWRFLDRKTDRPDAAATAPASEAAASAAPFLPSFDIVRVDRGGQTVFAGRAEPRSQFALVIDGVPGRVRTVDGDGAWVADADIALDAGVAEIGLTSTTREGQTYVSDESILVVSPAREGEAPLVLKTAPGAASLVLQDPAPRDQRLGPLAIDSADYDGSGAAVFSGRAEAARTVELYIQSETVAPATLLGRVTAARDGVWSVAQFDPPIPPGRFRMIAVQLGEKGAPVAVVEVPFERWRPREPLREGARPVVEQGNGLRRIARRAYGGGAQYTINYEPTPARLRDPAKRFPGQAPPPETPPLPAAPAPKP